MFQVIPVQDKLETNRQQKGNHALAQWSVMGRTTKKKKIQLHVLHLLLLHTQNSNFKQ